MPIHVSFLFFRQWFYIYKKAKPNKYSQRPKYNPKKAKVQKPIGYNKTLKWAIGPIKRNWAVEPMRTSRRLRAGHVGESTQSEQNVSPPPRLNRHRLKTPPEHHHRNPRFVGAQKPAEPHPEPNLFFSLCFLSESFIAPRDLIRQYRPQTRQNPRNQTRSINGTEP